MGVSKNVRGPNLDHKDSHKKDSQFLEIWSVQDRDDSAGRSGPASMGAGSAH